VTNIEQKKLSDDEQEDAAAATSEISLGTTRMY